jgi:glycosyltransferase involved in cell wall biosynthesis
MVKLLPLQRIFSVTPIPHDDPASFWRRESGLIVMGLREMGYDSSLITLHSTCGKSPVKDSPGITCTLDEMSDPAWWAALRPDAIILNLWSAPRYDAIRKAALKNTPRVIERLDASGVRVPRTWPAQFFREYFGTERDRGRNVVTALARATARSLLYSIPAVMERPMALTMAQLPYVVAESPLAAARVERHIRWHSNAPVQVAQISHPVYTKLMHYRPGDPKTNVVVAVGRWDTQQKDFPLLLATAVLFLSRHADWSFDIVGRGVPRHQKLLDRVPVEIMKRIRIHGSLPYEEVVEINRRAKIHFISSRWEGFCNATVEALCCGCSYVGPIEIGGASYLIENRSGTISSRRRPTDMMDALSTEVEAWKTDRRNAAAIAESWIEQSGYLPVTRRTLALFETIPAENRI